MLVVGVCSSHSTHGVLSPTLIGGRLFWLGGVGWALPLLYWFYPGFPLIYNIYKVHPHYKAFNVCKLKYGAATSPQLFLCVGFQIYGLH
jgi:hypothetical protein